MTTDPVTAEPTDFASLGLAQPILKALNERSIAVPTPIQHQTIPPAVQGKDIVGIAQTGTGKTFAFGLPTLHRLIEGKGRALIIVPTRELAYQVEESLMPFARAARIRTAVFVGGSSFFLQRKMLKQNPRILIATPGRLWDHLERKTVTLREVQTLVMDEADRMLDMGFKPQIDRILEEVPKKRQTLLFSATMPKEIYELASKEMKLPLRIEIAPEGTTAKDIEQELIVVRQEHKGDLLLSLLQDSEGPTLVFSRTKHGAKKITKNINTAGHRAAEIHANRSLSQRRDALEGFKKGKYRILVATDIAARGIDVTGIAFVINYDLPDDAADYVHRIGRTGRAGKSGRAISFATPSQAKDVKNIERLIRISIPRREVSGMPTATLEDTRPPFRGRKSFPRRGSGSRSPRPRRR